MSLYPSLDRLLARDPNLRVRVDPNDGVVRYLRGRLGVAPVADAGAAFIFIEEHPDLFGDVELEQLKQLAIQKERHGIGIVLQQLHNGYPVWSGTVRFYFRLDGRLDGMSNRMIPGLRAAPAKPSLTAGQAVAKAQVAIKSKGKPRVPPELVVYRPSRQPPRLVWRLELREEDRKDTPIPAQWVVFLDAVDGQVVRLYSNIQTVGAHAGTGKGWYSPEGPLNAWNNGTVYELRDTTRTATGGPEISTGDYHGSSPATDQDGDWLTTPTATRYKDQGALVDVHRFAGAVADYFATVHGRNSFDGAGATFQSLVHWQIDLPGAWWDGEVVHVGDGDGFLYSFCCCDDWVAHEFTHAYVQYTCGLSYENESGALNEAFCDTFAAFITGDWYVFEDSWYAGSAPAGEAPASRNMVDPTNGGKWNNASDAEAQMSAFAGHHPDHYGTRYTWSGDNGGVHINSSIINHLFYLLTEGGTHALSGVTVSGIGRSAAEQLLYHCMAQLLVGLPDATFNDFREAMIDACLELFPNDLSKLTQTKRAFNAVGIGPDLLVRDNLTDDGHEPYEGEYLWASPDIINRIAPEPNPAVAFGDPADGGLSQNIESGQDNYIYVRLHNRGASNGDAVVSVYLVSAAAFAFPSTWAHIGDTVELGIAPGSMRIAGPVTVPKAAIPGLGHYCIVAVVNSGPDPAPDLTLISTVADYISYVRNSNNIAYRNLTVVDAVPGGVQSFGSVVYGTGDQEQFDLRIRTRRLPPWTRVRVRFANGPKRSSPRGLREVTRTGDEITFEPNRIDSPIGRQFTVLRRDASEEDIGLDGVVVADPFKLTVEVVLPSHEQLRPLLLQLLSEPTFELRIEQRWLGIPLGAVAWEIRMRHLIGTGTRTA